MLQITICDDEEAQLSLLEAYVREWAGKRQQKTEIGLCGNAEQFLFHWEEKRPDIALLVGQWPCQIKFAQARVPF